MLACKKCLINMRTVWYRVNDKMKKKKKYKQKKESNKMQFVDVQLDLVHNTPVNDS